MTRLGVSEGRWRHDIGFFQALPAMRSTSGLVLLRWRSWALGSLLPVTVPRLRATELTEYATAVINALQEAPQNPAPPDPPVVVVTEPELSDVGLRTDSATTHSGLVDRMVTELPLQDGVASVHRDAHDALVVNAPDWDADNLQRWLQAWFEIRAPRTA